MEWNEQIKRWRVTTTRGDSIDARFIVICGGVLHAAKLPAIPGVYDFQGESFHTARWKYSVTGGSPTEPMDKLGDKVVGIIGTGATAIQAVPKLAEAAKHVYVFQRTPSAIGVRGNRDTDPMFTAGLEAGWQQERMDNFQAIMLGRAVERDLTDDGWTHHYAQVHHPPRTKGMTLEEVAIRYREVFLQAGGRQLRYVPALNDRPDHLVALSHLAIDALTGWLPVPHDSAAVLARADAAYAAFRGS